VVGRRGIRRKFLGMPLHADDPPAVADGSLEAFNDPVRGARGHAEPIADLIDRLVMHGVHLCGGRAEGGGDA